MSSRRRFIRLAGASAAFGTLAACAEIPDAANAPWRETGRDRADPRLRLLQSAILSPNPHNIQPWAVELSGRDNIVLYCDRARLLPETDPFNRQIAIGLGCFLETLDLAARQSGRLAEIVLFPAGMPQAQALDDRPIAHIRLTEATATPDPLFAQLLARRSNKKPFDTNKPVPGAALASLRNSGRPEVRFAGTTDAALLGDLRRIAFDAVEVEFRTPRTFMESVKLMRIGASEIARHRDGISLGGPMIEFGRSVGMVSREALADPNSTGFRRGLDRYRALADSAMGFVWLATPGNDRRQQIEAGRAHMRLNLQATALGLALQPMSQVLQEFPEMAALQRGFRAHIGAGGETVQMLSRIGYGSRVEASPRRPLEAAIRRQGA